MDSAGKRTGVPLTFKDERGRHAERGACVANEESGLEGRDGAEGAPRRARTELVDRESDERLEVAARLRDLHVRRELVVLQTDERT